jgi:hypothetical protein
MDQFALCSAVPPCNLGTDGAPAVYVTVGGLFACDAPHTWHNGRLYWHTAPGPECPTHQCERLHAAQAAAATITNPATKMRVSESAQQRELRRQYEENGAA